MRTSVLTFCHHRIIAGPAVGIRPAPRACPEITARPEPGMLSSIDLPNRHSKMHHDAAYATQQQRRLATTLYRTPSLFVLNNSGVVASDFSRRDITRRCSSCRQALQGCQLPRSCSSSACLLAIRVVRPVHKSIHSSLRRSLQSETQTETDRERDRR